MQLIAISAFSCAEGQLYFVTVIHPLLIPSIADYTIANIVISGYHTCTCNACAYKARRTEDP
ncbi:hypothetical protein CPSG_02438 [Coccidioides posadasii str. Silveira]|uniref:Uncharacterized protein n=1 Tax=Coccidioides posadasii (strain RMSCC 757 / Silveira) TaxID=443226 RepID=E9CZF1_COCPS|nr:hypothetical protein CPSG_02438 [Coccidioides posadasii str. Silveira]